MKNFWALTEGIFCCLIDEERTQALKKSIGAAVAPGDVVVDAGSGSGILALFALEAGAGCVYAVENDKACIEALKQLAVNHPLGKRLKVVSESATKVLLPEKADVIIAELVYTGLIEELQVPVMNNLLKSAKPQVKVVIQKYCCFADLVVQKNDFYGQKLNIIRYEYKDFPSLKAKSLTSQLPYLTVDFTKHNSRKNVRAELSVEGTERGIANGLRVSGETTLYGGLHLKDSFAYSCPVILPIEPLPIMPGQKYQGYLEYRLCGGFKTLSYNVCMAEGKAADCEQ